MVARDGRDEDVADAVASPVPPRRQQDRDAASVTVSPVWIRSLLLTGPGQKDYESNENEATLSCGAIPSVARRPDSAHLLVGSKSR
jgi:hypothetical protein